MQMWEMLMMNPSTFARNMNLVLSLRLAAVADAPMLAPYTKALRFLAQKSAAATIDAQTFDDILKAWDESGMFESIDKNVLVHGIFEDAETMLIESPYRQIARKTKAAPVAVGRLSRSVGFDPAELTNRMGLWLQAWDLWKQQNPGKDWRTKENKEIIAFEALRLSGVMNRAGSAPYQDGMWSPILQFVAINQKLLMNILQDDITLMTPAQRLKLGATRFVLYGGKYGLPFGGLLYALVEAFGTEDQKDAMEMADGGLADIMGSKLFGALFEDDKEVDLALGRTLSPYSEYGLPYFDFMHNVYKLTQNRRGNQLRFPALSLGSAMYKTFGEVDAWFKRKDISTPEAFRQALTEASELATGMNNLQKGLLLRGAGEHIAKNGSRRGDQIALGEAYAKMFFGIESKSVLNSYRLWEEHLDHEDLIQDTAKEIHRVLQATYLKTGRPDKEAEIQRQINSFVNLLPESEFSDADIVKINDLIWQFERNTFKDQGDNLYSRIYDRSFNDNTKHLRKQLRILKNSKDERSRRLAKDLEEQIYGRSED